MEAAALDAEPTEVPSGGAFRRNVAWAAAGNAIYAACQWAMLIALARLGTPETVGNYALALALTAPLFLLAGLQLRGIQATDSRGEFRFGDYLGVRIVAMTLATVASVAAATATTRHGAVVLTVLVVALAKSIEGLSDVHYGYLQHRERLDVVARSLIARGALALLGLIVGMIFTRSPAGAAAGMASAWLVVLLVHDIPGARTLLKDDSGSGAPRFAWTAMRRLVTIAAPLGVVIMLVSLQTNVPRYLIERHLGTRELGIFAALSSLVAAGNVFIGAIGQAAAPRLAREYAAGRQSGFRRSLLGLALAGAGLGAAALLVAVVAAGPLLRAIFGPEYAERPALFIWLMVGGGIGYVASLLGYGMTAARQFRPQVPLFVVVLAVLGSLCAWLVPAFGLEGAAWALAVASAVQLFGSGAVVFHAVRGRSR